MEATKNTSQASLELSDLESAGEGSTLAQTPFLRSIVNDSATSSKTNVNDEKSDAKSVKSFKSNRKSISADVPKVLGCTSPSLRNRLSRKVDIHPVQTIWIYAPKETFFAQHQQDTEIDPWVAHVHPDGLLYFSCTKKESKLRFLTEANLYKKDDDLLFTLSHVMMTMESEMREKGFTPDPTLLDADFVDVLFEIQGKNWYYYMADRKQQNIFWLRSFDATWMSERVGGVETKSQLKHRFDQEYWMHIEHFPHDVEIPDKSYKELRGILLFGCIDAASSSSCTMFLDPDEAGRLIDLIENFKEMRSDPILQPYINASVARLLALFSYSRFMNFAGSVGARIVRTQPIRSAMNQRSRLFKFLSCLLLFSANSYLSNLQEIWVDSYAHRMSWKTFKAEIELQWQNFILYSTVLLTSNVSFLALNMVSQSPGNKATVAQIVSQVSIIDSIGSIIVGLLLLRRHSLLKADNMGEVTKYLKRQAGTASDLETLAIIYCLPYALLLWGMITFLVAFANTCFNVPGFIQIVVNGVAWFCVLVPVSWTVLSGSHLWAGSVLGTIKRLTKRRR